MTAKEKKQMKLLQKALDNFPRIVAEKKKRAVARKKFVAKTFGPLARELARERKKTGA